MERTREEVKRLMGIAQDMKTRYPILQDLADRFKLVMDKDAYGLGKNLTKNKGEK